LIEKICGQENFADKNIFADRICGQKIFFEQKFCGQKNFADFG